MIFLDELLIKGDDTCLVVKWLYYFLYYSEDCFDDSISCFRENALELKMPHMMACVIFSCVMFSTFLFTYFIKKFRVRMLTIHDYLTMPSSNSSASKAFIKTYRFVYSTYHHLVGMLHEIFPSGFGFSFK